MQINRSTSGQTAPNNRIFCVFIYYCILYCRWHRRGADATGSLQAVGEVGCHALVRGRFGTNRMTMLRICGDVKRKAGVRQAH